MVKFKVEIDDGKFIGHVFHVLKEGGLQDVDSGKSQFLVAGWGKVGDGRFYRARFFVDPSFQVIGFIEEQVARCLAFAAHQRGCRSVFPVAGKEFAEVYV